MVTLTDMEGTRLDSWKWEDRETKRKRQQTQLQGLQQQIAPLVEEGNIAGALRAVQDFRAQVLAPKRPSLQQRVGNAVKQQLEKDTKDEPRGSDDYRLDFRYTLPIGATIGPITTTPENSLSNVNLRAKEGQIAQYDEGGSSRASGHLRGPVAIVCSKTRPTE
jgi:hypothetical protein